MAIVVSQIKLPLEAPREEAFRLAGAVLGNPPVRRMEIYKQSVDARRREKIQLVYAVWAELDCDEKALAERLASPQVAMPSVFAAGNFRIFVELLAMLKPARNNGMKFQMKGRNGETVRGRYEV